MHISSSSYTEVILPAWGQFHGFSSQYKVVKLCMARITYTVNIYRYKSIGANANTSVISTTWKCISPCMEILYLL